MEGAERDEVIMALVESILSRPKAEREAYLRAVCEDTETVAEVLDRVAWEENMGGFLQTPMVRLAEMDGDPSVLTPGRKIGHYRVEEELGQGGMGTVYKAVDEKLGRTVALKVLLKTTGTAADRQRFLREAKSASALNHPNIVTIHEFDSDNGLDFIAMEYIEGQTLDKAISPELPLKVSLEYARQIAGALAKAHAAGIVHRDLKPGNVMVTKDGEVKVLDFGLAKRQHSAVSDGGKTETTEALTAAGSILGTPAYMSPEQVLGERLDQRSDIFSFGIMLYQIACGERPFSGATKHATLVQIASQAHRPVREVKANVPPALAALIDRCLAKKRENRLASMDLAAAELSEILAGLGKRPQPRKIGWIVAVALGLAAAGGAARLWMPRPHQAPAPLATASPIPTVRYSLLSDQGTTAPVGATFRGGAKVRFRLFSSAAGFVYVVNEGPGENGRNRFYVVAPRPGASAAIGAQESRLTGWLVFDSNAGVERFWVIWARQPVQLLDEAVEGTSRGLVREANEAAAIQKLFASLHAPGETSVNASGDEMQVRSAGKAVASVIELRHQ